MNGFADSRPPPSQRTFRSGAVERVIDAVTRELADPELAWMFRNCFPNTLDTTVAHTPATAFEPTDTYIVTGDIAAMWLRDSAAQVWPYLPLARQDADLAALCAGLVNRQSRCVLLDPFANAFYRTPVSGEWAGDRTAMRPGVHERKWELDSLAYFLRLSRGYAQCTGDLAPFDANWLAAFDAVVATLRVEQRTPEASSLSRYRFRRLCDFGDSLANGGLGEPSRDCGLVRSAFRPSDDACKLPFHVPSNLMVAAELAQVAGLLSSLGQHARAATAVDIATAIDAALRSHAVVEHKSCGEIWAYEVDGFGSVVLMDDANAPSLLSLPYLGACSATDARYTRTRAFCLGPGNPYFVAGSVGSGIGSPHTGRGTLWPIGVIVQALTSTDDAEISGCLALLKQTHAGTGFMHESFPIDDLASFTRPWFAWANSLFGELILALLRERPHLLRRTG